MNNNTSHARFGSSEDPNDSGLVLFGIIFLYLFGAFVALVYSSENGPFPSLPHHYLVLGIALSVYVFLCHYFTHRSDGLQREHGELSMISFLGRWSMAVLLLYSVELIPYGISYLLFPAQPAFKQLPLPVNMKVIIFAAVFYGACVRFLWSYYQVAPEKVVVVDNNAFFPSQEVFLSPLKQYHLYSIDKVIRLPRTIIHDVEFKSGDCLPVTFDTSVEIGFDEAKMRNASGNGITKDLLTKESAVWIKSILREHAKEKTLTEFLTMQYPPVSKDFAGWRILWKPDLPVIWPITVKL